MSAPARQNVWRPPQVPLWVLPLVLLAALWLAGAVRSLHEQPGAEPQAAAPHAVVADRVK
jgi:hypothetical protein